MKIFIKIIFVFMFILIFAVNYSYAGKKYEWKQIKNKNGITIFEKNIIGSKFKMYQAKTIINQPMEVLFEVLLDVPGYSEWMPDVESARIVKMIDKDRIKGNLIVHVLFDAMWPVKNREVVIKALTTIDWDKGHVVVNLNETLKYNVPQDKKRSLIKKFHAVFDFKYIDRKHTSVTYQTHADPGGVVPAGIAKIQTAGIPYKTLKNLAEIAKKPTYYKMAMRDYF